MVWLTLGISALTLLGASLAVLMVTRSDRAVRQVLLEQLTQARADHLEQRRSWEVERERLLNRAMTKEWESYTQMSAALTVTSPSDQPPQGLSDETEAQRWAEAHGAVGETFAELHGISDNDIRDLGLSG